MPSGYPQKSALTAGDPTGRFLGGRAYPASNRDRLPLWDNGILKLLPHQGEDEEITAINRHGTAVITAFIGSNIQSWVYHDGAVTRLKGNRVSATAINDSGVIVGSMKDGRDQEIPVVWRTFTAEPTLLPMPAPEWTAWASTVDEHGYIVGTGNLNEPRTTAAALAWSPEGKLFSPRKAFRCPRAGLPVLERYSTVRRTSTP